MGAGEVDVGVVEEGGEVVLGKAEAEALVVDEPGAVFVNEDVLALEVPMDEAAGQGGEASAEVAEGLFDGGAIFVRELFLKVAADEVVEEVVLLPEVEGVVEGGFEFDLIVRGELGFGDGVDFGDFLEGGFIPGAEDIPGFVPVGVEVVPAEVLEPDAEAAFVVMEDGGDMDAEGGEALGGGGEFGVVAAGVGVNHEDHGLLAGGGPGEAVVVSVGAAFEDGLELTGEAGQLGELLAGEDVESFVFGGHGGSFCSRFAVLGLEVGVFVGAGGGDVGADDGAGEAGAGFDVGVGPKEAVFEGGSGFDDGVGADDVMADQGGGGVDLREGVDGGLTERGADLGEVGVEIGGAVAEVPPVAFVEDEPADAVAGFDEFEEDGDDGFLFAGGEPVEEGGADHVDAGEEVGAVVAGAEEVADVEQEAGFGVDGDVGGGAGGAEGEGDEIAAVVVMFDEGVEGNVGKDVAVVDQEGVGAVEEVADVGDAAGGFEAVGGFVAEAEGDVRVTGGGEGFGVGVREVMGVDDDVTCA